MDNPVTTLRFSNLRGDLMDARDAQALLDVMREFSAALQREMIARRGDVLEMRYLGTGEEQAQRLRDARLLPLDAETGGVA